MALGWRLPARPLRDGAIRALTLGGTSVILAATLAGPWIGASPSYPVRALLIFVAVMAVAIGHLHDGHPFPTLGAANRVTTVRVLFVSLIAGLLAEPLSANAAIAITGLGLLASGFDGLDGPLARRARMASPFGARFDMEVDAFFILVLSALAWRAGKAGAWILLAGLLRYLFVGAMQAWPWMRRQQPPSLRRKTIAVVQMIGLSVVMLPAFMPPLSAWWCAVVLLTLVYSFAVDTLWLWRHRG
jgi:phosphatidylglycerophosphate synthase